MISLPEVVIRRVGARSGWWAGVASLILSMTGSVVICLNDPYWLALPISAAGIVTGCIAFRSGHENHVGAHLGVNLGWFNLLLWIIIMVVAQQLLGLDLGELFEFTREDFR